MNTDDLDFFQYIFGYWRYLYSLKQWFPLSATTIWPSCVRVKPWGPYKGQASVLTKDRNEPWLSKICIRELPQSATIILSWASTATPVGALNWPFPSPFEPKVNKNSPWESNTWKENSIFYRNLVKQCYTSKTWFSGTLSFTNNLIITYFNWVIMEIRNYDMILRINSHKMRTS